MIRRRSAIEPAIGHMKADGKLDRNWLKGVLGDAIHSGAVRRQPQPANDHQEAEAFLRPCSDHFAQPLDGYCRRGITASVAQNELLRLD